MDNTKTPELSSKDRTPFLDSSGRPLTQSLFLEIGYRPEAIYTLKDYHFEYEGRYLPSAKLLYLEMNDPTEYEFAERYFLNWNHWQRIAANNVIKRYVDEWRAELEIKLRSRAVRLTVAHAESGNHAAAKWLAEKGWDKRDAGRPTKAEVARERAVMAKAENEYSADVVRLKAV